MGVVKIPIANKTNKQAIGEWDEFLDSIRNSTPIDINETSQQKAKRIKELEKPGNQEEWFKYYFPKYCFSEPADFQIKSTKKVLSAKRFYQRRAWARGLSKSTRRMFEIFYKKFVQKWRVNMLLISKSEMNAIRLLAPYKANLEANQRLINDYGIQERPGKWGEDEFITRDKCSFRAVGTGQNPRGAKLEEMRVNVLDFDDADDDEVINNPERLDKVWEWIETAVIPTVEMSADYLICFDNNIIGEDSIAVRAAAYADDVELVNWRDESGKSTWPQKNKEEDIVYLETHLSYEAVQKEGYNNPMSRGKTFKEITWDECPSISSLPFVLQYADPATSNKDKPTAKSKAINSCKGTALLGFYKGKFYVYNCFLDNMNNSHFIDGMFELKKHVGDKNKVMYSYIENNTLQDPFYQQVLIPLISQKRKETKIDLSITPDIEKKPEKWFRIEADLEPLVRLQQLIFNIKEKNNPHMKRMEAQFLNAKPTSKELGGPDIIQGAVRIIRQKSMQGLNNGVSWGFRKQSLKRF